MSFVHLHTHSHYSLLDGLAKVDDLVTKAKNLGMPALALTDHGVMYGLVEFYQKAKKAGIKPILGVEAYVARNSHTDKRPNIDTRPYHLVLLAKNEVGYHNLIKLTTIAHLEGFYYKPRIDHELLKQYGEGIICLSACLAGELARALQNNELERAEETIRWHEETFGRGNYYLEVQHHPNIPEQGVVNERVFELAKKFDIKVVATADIHYLNQEDAEAQDALVCIQTKKLLSDTDRMSMTHDDFSMATAEEMAERWADHPEVITNTLEVAEKCNVELTLGKTLLPHFEVPEGQTPNQYLADLCEQGLIQRYGKKGVTKEIRERLDYELDIIGKTGFGSYFLIVSDFITWAKNNGVVVGPGRGSAAGSLVAYLTNITNIDPLKYDLLFERFLNPERISMPDIDTDFADTRRDQVLEYVSQKYGSDHVAQIITFGTMAARAAIRDTGRVMGLPYSYCDRISKLIPMFTKLGDALKVIPELKEVMNEPDGKRLIEIALKLEGVARHASTHACGVVITPDAMDQHIPRQRSSQDENEIVTQYEMHAVEDLGLLKIDFLGLKNLTIIEYALDIIRAARGIIIDMDTLPLDDAETFKLFQRAETTGVFQLESSGMRRYLKQLVPTELEDIIAMVSLYRPGPMEFIPEYVAAKHGKREVTYLDHRMEPILSKTYGIIVYQEQVMQIARTLGGFTYGEADVLRKAVGKKIASLLREQEEKMINGMIKNGIKPNIAQQIWDYVLPFARYGFNRSHAACYAMIAYQTAFLKAHYPAEFMASLLTADHGNTDRIAIEVEECRQMGIQVLPPDINESFSTFSVVYDTTEVRADKQSKTIRFGLSAVKNLGEQVIKEIIKERKANGSFTNLEDLLSRVKTKDLNKKSLEALIKTGALDMFGERNQLLVNIEKLLSFIKRNNEESASQQSSLFGMLATPSVLPKLVLDTAPAATDKDKLNWEKEFLGLYVSAHPLSDLHPHLAGHVLTIGELLSNTIHRDKSVMVAGVISKVKKIVTKKGELMLFVRIEDVSHGVEVLVFPRTLQENSALWLEDKIIVMNCHLSDKDDEMKLICEQAREIDVDKIETILAELRTIQGGGQANNRSKWRKEQPKAEIPSASGYAYILVPPAINPELTEKLKTTFGKFPGTFQVCLAIKQDEGYKKVLTNYRVDGSPALEQHITAILGERTFKLMTPERAA